MSDPLAEAVATKLATQEAPAFSGVSRVGTAWQTVAPIPVGVMDEVYFIANSIPDGWINQFRYFVRLFENIRNKVEGDVIECGLGEGNTFAMLAYLISMDKKCQRTLWGFDSFEGWPEPTPADASPRNPQRGEWKVSEDMVRTRLEQSGLSGKYPHLNISITKGFVGDTLPKFPRDQKIAFLHIDLDLETGYRDALENLWDLVVLGGIVCFDEYREFHPELPNYIVDGHPVPKWPGCDKAVDEFFAGKNEVLEYHAPTQKYYVVKGKGK